jgi:predicted restriction endonuclease
MSSKTFSKEDILNEISSMHDKYESLVKYARVTPEQISEHKLVQELVNKVQSEYTNEVNKLSSVDGDWHHGFNSGMLAALRYIITMDSIDKDTAQEWFPELDT